MIRKVHIGGHCMGPDFAPCVATVDDEAEINAGDYVLAHFRVGNSNYSICKQLETWDGQWFLWARTGVVLLAGHQLVLAHIERITHLEKLPTESLPRGPECFASLEDMGLQDIFTREARKGWNEHGFPRDVKFPGLDALYPYRGPEVRLTEDHLTRLRARASIPASNPTVPQTPASFDVIPTVSGTIVFKIGDPVVRPRGTQFQIIRAVGSTTASANTIIFDGAAQNVELTSPNSLHWFFARAYVGSYFSALIPNTFGTAGRPAPLVYTWHVDTLAASTIS